MLILLIALPLLTGLAAALPFPSRRGRLTFLLTMQIIETALVVWTLVSGRSYTTNIWHLTESLTIAMKLDGVAAVFSALTAVAWLLAQTGRLDLVWTAFIIAEIVSATLSGIFLRRTFRSAKALLNI